MNFLLEFPGDKEHKGKHTALLVDFYEFVKNTHIELAKYQELMVKNVVTDCGGLYGGAKYE